MRQILHYVGDGSHIKKMRIGKWDISTNNIDYKTLNPKF